MEAVAWVVSIELTPDAMVSIMLHSEGDWKHIEFIITMVRRTKNLDVHGKRSNGEGGLSCRADGQKNFFAFLTSMVPRLAIGRTGTGEGLG